MSPFLAKGAHQRQIHFLSHRRRPLGATGFQSTICFLGNKFWPRKFASKSSVNSKESKNAGLFSMKQLDDGPSLILGTGKLAKLTKASVVAAMGDTVVLTTVATGDDTANNHIKILQLSTSNAIMEWARSPCQLVVGATMQDPLHWRSWEVGPLIVP